MRLKIEWLNDSSDCETCGSSWANGAIVYLNDKVLLELEPTASCLSLVNWDAVDVYKEILIKLGYTIKELPS